MSLTEALHRKLAETSELTKTTWAERIAEVWVKEAVGGNFQALQMILERLEGPKAARYQAKTALPHPDDD